MTLLDKPLQSLTAEDLMTRDVRTIPGRMSLRVAAQLLVRSRVSGAPVVDASGRCTGVISTTDFLKLAGRSGEPKPFAPHVACDWQLFDLEGVPDDCVERYMTRDPVTATPEDTKQDAIHKMRRRGCRHLPIMRNGVLVDMLSMRDLLWSEISEKEQEIRVLHDYIQGNGQT